MHAGPEETGSREAQTDLVTLCPSPSELLEKALACLSICLLCQLGKAVLGKRLEDLTAIADEHIAGEQLDARELAHGHSQDWAGLDSCNTPSNSDADHLQEPIGMQLAVSVVQHSW